MRNLFAISIACALFTTSCSGYVSNIKIAHKYLVENTEFGIKAKFYNGDRICESLSGDHIHGYYVILGSGACRDDPSVNDRVMGFYSSYYPVDYEYPRGVLPPACESIDPNQFLEIANGRSKKTKRSIVGCSVKKDGSISTHIAIPGKNFVQKNPLIYTLFSMRTTKKYEDIDSLYFKRMTNSAHFSR